jgi:TatD DNase family protein
VELFDAHLHLDDPAFAADLDGVIARARAAGVVGMVTVGTDVAGSRAAVALAQRYDGVFAAVAVHPHSAASATPEAIDELRALAAGAPVVAVGETGLDYARDSAPGEAQQAAFIRHIQLSRDLRRPLVIHCREAYAEVLAILQREGVGDVVMHAFSGSVETARECVRRGYALSIGGPVTFKHATTTAQVAREVPLDALLVETDAPVLTPEPFRGRRNEPSYLPHVVRRIAELRETPVADVARATTANARRVFRV